MAEDYTPLASSADVVAALGRALTTPEASSVQDKLVLASELFRGAAGRQFTGGRSTLRLKVNGGEVRLPQTDITEIHSVTDCGQPVSYTRSTNILTVPLRSDRFVEVDFSHSDTIPELARTTVADIVARTFMVDDRAKAGMSQYQETTGPFSEGGTFAAWAVGGQVMLSPADLAAAQTFRGRRLPNTVVHRP